MLISLIGRLEQNIHDLQARDALTLSGLAFARPFILWRRSRLRPVSFASYTLYQPFHTLFSRRLHGRCCKDAHADGNGPGSCPRCWSYQSCSASGGCVPPPYAASEEVLVNINTNSSPPIRAKQYPEAVRNPSADAPQTATLCRPCRWPSQQSLMRLKRSRSLTITETGRLALQAPSARV